MSAPSRAQSTRITRLSGTGGGPLAGAFAPGSLAEVTHLPSGIASSRTTLVDVPPGSAIEQPAAAADLLVHVVTGEISAHEHPDGPAVQAGAGDTLLVPAGAPVRAVAADAGGPVQLLLVRAD